MAEIDFDSRVRGLRSWAESWGADVRAAVELLIWKGWPRRSDFNDACVTQYAPGLIARIDWFQAEHFPATAARVSSSERAILELAVALADREYSWLRFTGDAHAEAVVKAIAAAMGVDRG